MTETIELNQSQLNKLSSPRREQIRGVDVDVSPSPFDIPDRVEVSFDPETKRLLLEFSYIGREPTTTFMTPGGVLATIGRKSDRIYSLRCPIDPKEKEIGKSLIEVVVRALETLQKRSRPQMRLNYQIIQHIFSAILFPRLKQIIG